MKKVNLNAKKIIHNIFLYFVKYWYIAIFFFTLILVFFAITDLENILDKTNKYKFETIQDLKTYANFYPEDYEIENNDWINPIFINLYKRTIRHSILSKIFVKFGIKDDPIFNIPEFTNLLGKITEERLVAKFVSPFNKTLDLSKGDRCIIFGDVHASFHSFVRNLAELEKRGIINKNLKIISTGTYFVFLGDIISRAPYSLETLNIMLLLIEKNPEKLVYLRGNHETNSYWQNFNMRNQIKVLFPQADYSKSKDNLFDKIDKFFNTLPDALIINIKSKEDGTIICSNEERPKLYENKKNIKFMILGERRFDVVKETNGLEFVGYDYGVAKWSTISCQNVVYNKFFNFKNDAFLELSIDQGADNCILTLNSRDTREKNSVYMQTFYDPIFGKQLKSKSYIKPKNIIHIGSTMPLSGIMFSAAHENKTGLETALFFNNQKKENLIIPVILDDGYSTIYARSNIDKLLNIYKLNTDLAPMGTPTLTSYLDMVKSGKIYVFFPYTGAEAFRVKELTNMVHFRAGYRREAQAAMDYLIKEYGIKNFAFFYTNDSYGKPIAEVAHEILKKSGINSWLDLPHQKIQSEFKNEVEKLKINTPEAIGCFSVQAATQELIDELGADFFSGKIIFGVTFLFSDAFKKFLDDRGIKYIINRVVPDPDTSQLEIVKEFKQDMKIRGLKTSSNALEGYISGALISDAINKMQPPFTGEKMIKYFENMNNYSFKGLNLTFDPEKRILSQPVWLRTLDGKWITYEYKKY